MVGWCNHPLGGCSRVAERLFARYAPQLTSEVLTITTNQKIFQRFRSHTQTGRSTRKRLPGRGHPLQILNALLSSRLEDGGLLGATLGETINGCGGHGVFLPRISWMRSGGTAGVRGSWLRRTVSSCSERQAPQ